MKIHCRAHEFGPKRPRIRIWTSEMGDYGQFNVVEYEDVEALHQLLHKLDLGSIIVHRCESRAECKCRAVEKFKI